MGSILINSDFTDFYDYLSSGNGVEYKRSKFGGGRGRELSLLRQQGIKTIETKPVSKFDSSAEKLLIYTDVNMHDKMGKVILRKAEADLMYHNKLASQLMENSWKTTYKLVYVGKRRFRLVLESYEPLGEEYVVSIEEMQSSYSMTMGKPIFSIDYINTDAGLLAIDLNSSENLGKLGIERFMKAEDVVGEIYNAMILYNLA